MEYVVNGKKYTDLKEAQEAEKKFEIEKAKKQTLVETKKARATEIEEAFKDLRQTELNANKAYREKVEEAKKIYQEAVTKAKDEFATATKEKEDKYLELKNSFIKDYGSYHMSSYTVNGDTEVTISDIINSVFDSFDSFWNF